MEEKDKIIYVSVDDIIPNRFQPRLAFDEKELNSLSESIKKYGVIQPIVLRKIGEKYEIIAGADNKDFFRVAEKYFPEEAALRLYSADSKK